ncbi:DNA gyrase inhibitor [Bacillus sp. UMB0899]|uniref:AraC family transcriptional regulator n=1 Tax=Metabacillus schmidteae TaxID=2730405 RepID=UPI000C7FAD7A|nr:GyrI-like domain-containing protein [Metabacillus schmidteae]PMC34425.1 DNA gyrase inhibitor [Bacillus sp. UMB0899]
MKYKVETLPNYRVAYIRRVGPYGNGNSEVWEKLKIWAGEKNLLNSSTILLAVQQDNPETTLPENCRFDACIVISEEDQIDDSISKSELSGGQHMVFQVKHTKEDIQQAYAAIFPFLQNNGYQIENKPIFERYIGDMNNNHYCEICVPVKL